MIELELGNAECGRNAIQGGTQAAWYCCLQNPGLYLCICVFVYLCICVFVYLCIKQAGRRVGYREAAWYCCLQNLVRSWAAHDVVRFPNCHECHFR